MTEVIPKVIDREGVLALLRRGVQLIDVQPRQEYDQTHLEGALSIPLSMISRQTADRLSWDKPVIVYSQDSLCDRAPRAAWRLSTLGFTQIFVYSAGKADWLANGLMVAGQLAQAENVADLADMDVPTCKRLERVGEVARRVRQEGQQVCVVLTDQLVVLGLLRKGDLERADPGWTVEEAMLRDPLTFRLDSSPETALKAMDEVHQDAALVTFTDGKLYGLLRREDLENR
jgi:rhodanese-related sulfurtransferase/CBS domain-containing protein